MSDSFFSDFNKNSDKKFDEIEQLIADTTTDLLALKEKVNEYILKVNNSIYGESTLEKL